MRFKEWLLAEDIQIYGGDDDSEAASGAAYVMDDAGLRWTRDKSLLLVAVDGKRGEDFDGSDVVGCVVYSWGPDHESEDRDHYVFDFDTAVRRDYQAKPMLRVGPRLIDAAIAYYRSLASEVDSSEIRVYAVNPNIVKFLTGPRYGFRVEEELQGGKAILSWRR
jgi:ribosomal protein S18 acetylase RimI-like enzyme